MIASKDWLPRNFPNSDPNPPPLSISLYIYGSDAKDDSHDGKNHLNYQDAQDIHDDWEMSFDSIALHNLDT